jgi:isochorismate hydrolase
VSAGAISLPVPKNGPIVIQPNKSALVIIDMQNYFLHQSLGGDPKGRAVVRKFMLLFTCSSNRNENVFSGDGKSHPCV